MHCLLNMMNMTHNSIGKCSLDDNEERASCSTWVFLPLEFIAHYHVFREDKYFFFLLSAT